jgi:phage terminase Nu1 subunit (DNA packaging protein)
MSSTPSLFVSVTELAQEAGVSVRTVQTWAKAGYFSKQGSNAYDILGYYRWYTRSLRQDLDEHKAKVARSDWDTKWREGRARKSLAEASLVELQMQSKVKQVVPIDLVISEIDKVLSSSIRLFRDLPSYFSVSHCYQSSSEVAAALEQAVSLALKDFQSQLVSLSLGAELVEKSKVFHDSFSSSDTSS